MSGGLPCLLPGAELVGSQRGVGLLPCAEKLSLSPSLSQSRTNVQAGLLGTNCEKKHPPEPSREFECLEHIGVRRGDGLFMGMGFSLLLASVYIVYAGTEHTVIFFF